jgi:hypothetical protein
LRHEDAQSDGYFWSDHEADDEFTRLKLIERGARIGIFSMGGFNDDADDGAGFPAVRR